MFCVWPLRALSHALSQKIDSFLLLESGTECGFLSRGKRELRLLGFLAVCVQALPEAVQFGVLLLSSLGVEQSSDDAFHVRGAPVLFRLLFAPCLAPSVRGAVL